MTLNEIADYATEIKHYDNPELTGTIDELNAQMLVKARQVDVAVDNGVNPSAFLSEYKELKQQEEVLVAELVRRFNGGEQY